MPGNKILAMCFAAGLAAVSTCAGFAHNSFSPKYVSFYGIPLKNHGVPAGMLQVDLNGDGIPDVISATDAGIQTLLSSSGGNYTVHEYAQFFISSIPLAAGDFNGDGKMDVFFYDFDGGNRLFFTAYGDGHGEFSSTTTAPNIPGIITGQQNYILARTTDINGDGRPDIVFAYFNDNTGYVYARPYLNDGQSFTDAGNVFSYKPPNGFIGSDTDLIHTPALDFLLGDFDSDGHADFALRVLTGAPFPGLTPDNNLFILYGDGAGRFTSKAVFTHRQSFLALSAADMNDDGRSDLVGGDSDESVHIFFGGAGRSFSEKAIPASAVQIPLLSYYPPMLADFDGNGRKDIVFVAESSTNSSSFGVRGLYQLAAGSFSPGPYSEADTFTIDVAETAFVTFFGGDYNHDAKPDVAPFTNNRSANTHPNSADLMLNTGRNAVGACAAPAIGIHVCSPGSSSASPAHFSFSATSFYPIRKMEVWVDGVKKNETYHVFGNEGFSDVSLALSAGTHRVSFFSGGFDGTVTKKTISVTVP
jgi:hypothetical protein